MYWEEVGKRGEEYLLGPPELPKKCITRDPGQKYREPGSRSPGAWLEDTLSPELVVKLIWRRHFTWH